MDEKVIIYYIIKIIGIFLGLRIGTIIVKAVRAEKENEQYTLFQLYCIYAIMNLIETLILSIIFNN